MKFLIAIVTLGATSTNMKTSIINKLRLTSLSYRGVFQNTQDKTRTFALRLSQTLRMFFRPGLP